jgi:thiosulfate/3-mercaptopyruvate sulfurtransferase
MTLKRKVLVSLFSALFLFCLFNVQQAAFANGGVQPLVETGWLADNLKTPGISIVYVAGPDSQKANFDAKHIPGSVYLDFGKLMTLLGDGSNPPDKANFEAFANSLGIGNDSHVVLISKDTLFAAGAFWLFDYFGHKKLSMVNGTIEKWMKEGRPATGDATKINAATYKANPDAAVLANSDYVLKNLKNPKVAIVDTRGTEEYTGKNLMGNKRGGHIPGALDLSFYSSNLNNDGTFKSVKDLKAIYEAAGVTKDKEAITYCEAGVRAAHSYVVLKHLLGYPKVRNYVGSWNEWSSRLDAAKYPIEK